MHVLFALNRFLSTRRHPAHPVSVMIINHFRLILMRIRFRALDFGQVEKTNVVRASQMLLRAFAYLRK